MSFSADVKAEVLNHAEAAGHCLAAAFGAVINICGAFGLEEDGVTPYLVISSESDRVITYCLGLIKALAIEGYTVTQLERAGAVVLMGSGAAKAISLTGIGHPTSLQEEQPIPTPLVRRDCCKRAYLRAAFICCGSVNDPGKGYHFELVNGDYYHAQALKALIASFGIDAKIVERKNHYVLYLKEGEQIVDMLNLISAHRALMQFENSRILKEVRNNVNRIVNCETANLNKVVSASVRQREAIELIKSTVGFSYLSPQLEEVAKLRLENPSLSLKELGAMLEPPVGKSGVNHRLKKICEIAQQLKGGTLRW